MKKFISGIPSVSCPESSELIMQLGMWLMAMDKIADGIGGPRPMIYEMFRDKDSLAMECLETMNTSYMQELQEILFTVHNVNAAFYRYGLHGEKKNSEINRFFFEDLKKLYPHY